MEDRSAKQSRRIAELRSAYPWTTEGKPIVVSAPMMKISLARYALATSSAGGIGFLAGGFDLDPLKNDLAEAATLLKQGDYPNLQLNKGLLPIGVGVQNWGADLKLLLEALKQYPVTAVWFFAPRELEDLREWAQAVRALSDVTQIWVQVGTAEEAKTVYEIVKPEVMVIQGADAGGHGLAQRAGIITLLPEVIQVLEGHIGKEKSLPPLIAAGGVMDGHTAAATLCLGASGVCMGTRLLASNEANIAKGYQDIVLRARDGGVTTVSSTVYDRARGIKGWPASYQGRGLINQTYLDSQKGMTDDDNVRLYQEELKKGDAGWGEDGRMTTYAGTGVGLVQTLSSIAEIVTSVQEDAVAVLRHQATSWQ